MAFFRHARDRRSWGTSLLRPVSGATALAVAAGVFAGTVVPAEAAAVGPRPDAAQAAPSGVGRADRIDRAEYAARTAATARARGAEKPVTVDALTTENTRTVANPDGSFTLTQNAVPVRARKNKTWVPIDTTLARRSDGRLAPAAVVTDVSFSGGGSGPLATMTRDGKSVSLDWPTALPTPVVDGNTATYPSVLPDVDLAVTASAVGFGHVLVVKTAEAAADPALADLRLATDTEGVTLSENGSGDVIAKDQAGRTVFRADPPLVWDSAGETPLGPVTSAPTRTTGSAVAGSLLAPSGEAITSDEARASGRSSVHGPGRNAHHSRIAMTVRDDRISLAPDKALLTSPDTVYPLYIDPNWTGSPSLVSWASINSMGWKATTGSEARVGYLGNWSGCGDYCGSTARSYFMMNADGIRGANVTSATFRPWFFKAANSAPEPTEIYLDEAVPADLHWGNKPSGGNSTYVTTVPSCIGNDSCGDGQVHFDVTSAARTAAAGGRRTFEVKAQSESNNLQWKKIDPTQTDWTVTYYLAPYMDTTYVTTPQVTAFGGTYVNSRDVTMKATGGNVSGERVASAYEIWNWSNGQNTSAVANALYSAYTATGGSYTFRGLADGTYAWRGVIRSEQGGMWSGWSPWQVFTVDATAPPKPTITSLEFPGWNYGAAYSDQGTFNLTTYDVDNVAGYVFVLDGDLGATTWSQQSQPPTWVAGQPIVRGKQYWVAAANTLAAVRFAPGLVGPHHLNAKAVDKAGLTSAQQGDHLFYAGLTRAEYVYGSQLANGYAKDGIAAGPSTWTTANGASVTVQNGCCGIAWGNGTQAMLSGPVAVGDKAVFRFVLPQTGYWNFGANLTTSYDYGRYSLTLDQGTGTEALLAGDVDGYSSRVLTTYRDLGTAKRANDQPIELAAGVHTLTLKIIGKNASSGGHQAGLDTLRFSLMSPTCTLTDLSKCRNNIAVSPDNNHDAADADGGGVSFSAGELAAAGWTPGAAITVNGAPMSLPGYGVGKADNILASGQTVTVDTTGPANSGNAIVFLGFSTAGAVEGATGSITYPLDPDGTSSCGASTTHTYTIDSMPDWTQGDPAAKTAGFATRNLRGGATDAYKPQLFAVSVALPCPGKPISAIRLPVVTDKLTSGTRALHIMGVGIRTASYVPGTGDGQNWNGTWAARQDGNAGTWTDQTIRVPARITVGNSEGGKVRIRLSNAYGTTPVTFPHVSVAPQAAAGSPAAGALPLPVTFGGSASLTIPVGGEATSDPVELTAVQQSTLLVSLQLQGAVPNIPVHNNAQAKIWASAAGTGDHTADTAADAFPVTMPFIPYLTAVDVTPTEGNTGAFALYGDQTINSDTVVGDNAHHLSALIFDNVAAQYAADPIENPTPYGVLNLGRNSWNLYNNYLPALSGSANRLSPPSAGNPIDRAVLTNSNVRAVLISTGASDILNNATTTDVQQRLVALAQQIRQRYIDDNGVSRKIDVQVATIPNSLAMTTAQDTVRRTVNNYILCGKSDPTAGACTTDGPALGGNADGTVDFAAAVSTDGSATGPLDESKYIFVDSTTGKKYHATSYFQALANRFTLEVRGI
ncbi:hypothetical protein [Streptomyces sp. NBC_00094]|uniref:hypothetical protein n=1 Tax=Streptomyces sp. NBC_00094 TaxID=2903620 RepID=UPI00224F8A7F|nr:hypothetical protein [Streptomyces sp. NBC_00094]MCX5394913.1 hypothetical protein [Streptomyces sp. NBC_00094]